MLDNQPQSPRDALAARLHARFHGPLMSFFMRRVSDRAAAEDLTQDVFVRLLAAGDRERIDDVDAFVFKIAANLLKDRGRKTQRRGEAQLAEFDMAPVSALTREFTEERTAERVLLGKETIAEVLQALDELGQRTKDIYILFRLEGMKQKDIAELYGLGRSTVEKEVMRATLHLALRFGPRA